MSKSEKCREAMEKRWASRRDYWQEMLALHEESDMSISSFCEEMGSTRPASIPGVRS